MANYYECIGRYGQYGPYGRFSGSNITLQPCDLANNRESFMPYEWSMDRETEQDIEYLKDLYPKQSRKIQDYVEEECDLLDYEGSAIYDEYPDRFTLKRICDRIFDRALKDNLLDSEGDPNLGAMELEEYEATYFRPVPPQPNPNPSMNQWLRNMIEVLLYNEIFKRRCRRRNCRNKNLIKF